MNLFFSLILSIFILSTCKADLELEVIPMNTYNTKIKVEVLEKSQAAVVARLKTDKSSGELVNHFIQIKCETASTGNATTYALGDEMDVTSEESLIYTLRYPDDQREQCKVAVYEKSEDNKSKAVAGVDIV
tara:strand:- start:579 stop:971 length:393 start_codon:yes stop_codon:yes gene_type:complete